MLGREPRSAARRLMSQRSNHWECRTPDKSRYSPDVCDWCHMPLEPCPVCGYALSVIDHHCRHCSVPLRAFPLSRAFDAKHLSKMITAVAAIGVLVYLMFFR